MTRKIDTPTQAPLVDPQIVADALNSTEMTVVEALESLGIDSVPTFIHTYENKAGTQYVSEPTQVVHMCAQYKMYFPVAIVAESNEYEATNDFFGNDKTNPKGGFFYRICKAADADNQKAWRDKVRDEIEAAAITPDVKVEEDAVEEIVEETVVEDAPEVEAPKRTRRTRKTA